MAFGYAGIFGAGAEPNARAQRILDRLVALRPVLDEDLVAVSRWGAPSRFDFIEPEQTNPTVSVVLPEDPECEDSILRPFSPDSCSEEGVPILEYDEIDRIETIVRVENPDDPDQFVMVARIDNILFQGPNGEYHQFNYTHPA